MSNPDRPVKSLCAKGFTDTAFQASGEKGMALPPPSREERAEGRQSVETRILALRPAPELFSGGKDALSRLNIPAMSHSAGQRRGQYGRVEFWGSPEHYPSPRNLTYLMSYVILRPI